MRIRRKNTGAGRRRFSPLLWGASLVAAALVALGVTGTLAAGGASIVNTDNHVSTAAPGLLQLSERLLNAAGDGFLAPSGTTNPCPSVVTGTAPTAASPASADCAAINKFGMTGSANPLVAGSSNITHVLFTNDLSERNQPDGTLTITTTPCTDNVPAGVNGGPGSLCAAIQVHIVCTNGFTFGVPSLSPPATGLPVGVQTLATLPTTLTIGTLTPGTPNPAGSASSVACTFTTAFPLDSPAALDGFTTGLMPMTILLTPV